MTNNIFNNVGSFDQTDPKNIKPQAIDKDKYQKEEIVFKNRKFKRDVVLHAYLLNLMGTYIGSLMTRDKPRAVSSNEELLSTLRELRTLFNTLKKNNLSESADFAKELSTCWHKLLYASEHKIAALKKQVNLVKAQEFIKTIREFPPNSDYSFGYYLSGYAGEKWLPFPFIEILKFLYEDTLVNGEKGILHAWTLSLTEIIETFQL